MDLQTAIETIDQELATIDARRQLLQTARAALTELTGGESAAPATTVPAPTAARSVRQPRPPQGAPSTRALVLEAVRSKPKVWTTAALASALELKPATVLFHLAALRKAGTVTSEGAGQRTRYRPA